MFYLDSLLGNGSIPSGEVQIDIPYPEEWLNKWKLQNSPQSTAGLTLAGTALGGIVGGGLGAITGAIGGYTLGTVSDWISAGQIGGRYSIPVGYGYRPLRVFCTDDITVSLGNEWGSILPGLFNTSTKVSQMWNEGNVVTWLSGTKASWKASKPLTFPLTFYVFTLSEGQSALEQIEPMIEFAGVDQGNGRWDAFNVSGNSVRVHGGYRVNAFESTEQYIHSSEFIEDDNSTFKIHLNNKVCIDKLLLGDIQITQSNIFVKNGEPLYIKVQANFRTVGTPTVYDIKRWFGV